MRAIYDYIIYTDGGCECNPGGRGGYGAVIINNNTGELTDISGGFRSTTNNRMEVMAVIKALEKIEKDTHIQLFSDSQYVIKTMNGMFRKKKNIDLWKKLDKLAVAFKIEWNWVKGHNGNTYNERSEPEKFEKFDFRLNEEVYVDFKNWDESMQVDRENELKKIRQKMRMVGAKRVYIINIVVEDGTKYEIKESTDGIIEIPGLITKNGDIITKPIEKLAKEVK